MKIQSDELESRQTQLTVELPDDRVQAAMRDAAKRLAKNTRVHGFRPGKIPYNVLVGKLGEEVIFDEALEKLGQDVYREALDQTEIEPYAPGSLDEVVSRSPLVLRYTVPLAPQVDIGEYRDIRIEFEEPEVEDSAVDAFMEDLRQRQALIEPVDREIQSGDVAIVDIRGDLVDESEGGSTLFDEKGVSILVEEEYNWPVPGISDYLIGLSAAEEAEFEYTFPEDYANAEMQGKAAKFHLLVQEVKSRLVPEWTDDLAKNVGDFDDLLSLRIQVRENLQSEAERRNKAEYINEVMQALVEGSEISYPPVLLQNEVEEMVRELEQRLRAQNLDLQAYLKIEEKTEDEFRLELEPQAEERLKRALTLGKVVELEQVEVEGSDIDAEIEKLIGSFENEADKESARKIFDNPVGRNRINLDVISDRAVERLISIAKGEAPNVEASSEEPSKVEASTVEVPLPEKVDEENIPSPEEDKE